MFSAYSAFAIQLHQEDEDAGFRKALFSLTRYLRAAIEGEVQRKPNSSLLDELKAEAIQGADLVETELRPRIRRMER